MIDNEQKDDSYVVPVEKMPDAIKNKMDEAGKKYPIWNPKTEGEVVSGKVESVEFLEHLNSNAGGYIVRILNKENNKFVTFPNKVMVKKMLNLCPTGELSELINKEIYIKYIEEKEPQDSRLRPYKTYEVVEA